MLLKRNPRNAFVFSYLWGYYLFYTNIGNYLIVVKILGSDIMLRVSTATAQDTD